MDSQTLFTRTPPVRLFFLAAIPGSISMLASSLYYTLDGIFVGQFIGATAFAAINLAMPFVIINFSLADLVGVGSSVPISICLGRGEQKEANNIFTCAVLLILALSCRRGPFCRRPHAHPSHGRRRRLCTHGRGIPARLRPLLTAHHGRVRP